jgi:hypothetical protein
MLRHEWSGLRSLRIVLRFALRRLWLLRHAVLRNADAIRRADVRLRTAVWLSSIRLLFGGRRMRFSAIFTLPRQ